MKLSPLSLAVGLLLALLAACGAGSNDADSSGSGDTPATPQASDERDCLWALDSRINTLFPDRHAKYWVALLAIPPGGAVSIDGEFPHARYLSFNLYDETLSPIDALTDIEILPQPGPTNPYLAGADRRAAARDYPAVSARDSYGGGAPG